MKKSIFAKILILVLCLSLVLCGCGKDATTQEDDPTTAPTGQVGDPTNPSDPADPSDPGSPSNPSNPSNPSDPSGSLGGVLDDLFGGSIGGGELGSALECGKITLTVGDMITNVMYVDLENLKLADELTLNVEGNQLKAQLYLNEHDLVIALPDILPENYGVSFDTLAEDLPNSAIWTLMGISYEDFVNELAGSLDSILDTMNNAMDSLENAFPNIEKCAEELMAALEKCANKVETSSTSGTADIYGKQVAANIYTYTINNDSMEDMVYIMLDWFANNTETFSTILAETGMTSQDIIGSMDAIKSEVADFFETSNLTATMSMNFNPSTSALMSIDASFSGTIDGVEGGYFLNLTLGEDPAESGLYSFTFYDIDECGVCITLGNETVATKTTITLTVSELDYGEVEILFVGTASYDTANSAYALTADVDGEFYSINGICKITEEYFEFTVDTVNDNGEIITIDLRLVAEAISSSQIPNAPSYTNLLKMSDVELTSLLMLLQTSFG